MRDNTAAVLFNFLSPMYGKNMYGNPWTLTFGTSRSSFAVANASSAMALRLLHIQSDALLRLLRFERFSGCNRTLPAVLFKSSRSTASFHYLVKKGIIQINNITFFLKTVCVWFYFKKSAQRRVHSCQLRTVCLLIMRPRRCQKARRKKQHQDY